MKYIMLDTNIYLDMIVSRNKSNKAGSYDELVTLLENDKVKIILPRIVKEEVKRHLDSEIRKIGKTIKTVRGNIKDMYWINHVEQVIAFNNQISTVSKTLGELDDNFAINNSQFLLDSIKKIDVLFNHENCIEIVETDKLLFGSQKRKLYKRCPEHNEGKDSSADALIVETLVNLEDFITLADEDKIYFISRNTSDFSAGTSKGEKDKLHPDIKEDLIANNLNDRTEYRILFTKTIIDDFEEEAKGIIELQELIMEFEADEKIREKELIWDRINMDRESAGLSALGSDSSYFEEVAEDQSSYDFIEYLVEQTDDIKEKAETYLELFDLLDDELTSINPVTLSKKVDDFNDIYKIVPIENYQEDKMFAITSYAKLYIQDPEVLEELSNSIEVEDFLELGSVAVMKDLNGNLYEIVMTGSLEPRNDDTDTLYIMCT